MTLALAGWLAGATYGLGLVLMMSEREGRAGGTKGGGEGRAEQGKKKGRSDDRKERGREQGRAERKEG